MRASTEEFLYDLWFMADTILRPSSRAILGPDFDAWAWRNGLTRRLAQLERRKLIEQLPDRTAPSQRVVRLTEVGRLAVLGGRDPQAAWARGWDGVWRMVLFDLPYDARALRIKLHRVLRDRHFGYLQGSVWITPHAIADLHSAVAAVPVDPENFVAFEGRPVSGESDAAIVLGAWDLPEINRRYERHLDVLKTVPRRVAAGTGGCERIRPWMRREQAAWKHAVEIDPLLPAPLLPADYRGIAAWRRRTETLQLLARQLA